MNLALIVTSFASDALIMEYKDADIFAIEKGTKKVLSLGLSFKKALGDFDSFNINNCSLEDDKIIKLNPIKDESDTEYALNYVLSLGYKDIVILGTLQSRYDHSHALLQLLAKHPKCNIALRDDYNYLKCYAAGSHILIRGDYKYLGFFGFPHAKISIDDVKYPMKKMKLDFLNSIAISNEFLSNSAVLNVISGLVLCVQSKD